MSLKINNRKAICDSLKKYDYCSNGDNDFIEVTEWTNGEGIDIIINSNGKERLISLTRGQLDAIQYLTLSLDYQK